MWISFSTAKLFLHNSLGNVAFVHNTSECNVITLVDHDFNCDKNSVNYTPRYVAKRNENMST